jgi:AcrR family transcriptional regulator
MPVADRRAQLLEVGRRLFNTRSYEEISMEDIAAAAKISKGLVYHYFSTKRELYLAAVRAAAEALLAGTAPPPQLSGAERFRAGFDLYLDFVDQNGRAFAKLLQSGLGGDAEVSAILEKARRALAKRIARALGVTLASARVRLAIRAWIGFAEAASLDWIAHRDVDRATIRELLVTALYAAMGPEA